MAIQTDNLYTQPDSAPQRMVSAAAATPQEEALERALRPKLLDEYVGQQKVREQLEIDAAYAGYLDRQAADAAAFRRDENLRLPADIDYAGVGGLSNEVREKLIAVRPLTLGQAARIEGVTPGALTALLAHVRRRAA